MSGKVTSLVLDKGGLPPYWLPNVEWVNVTYEHVMIAFDDDEECEGFLREDFLKVPGVVDLALPVTLRFAREGFGKTSISVYSCLPRHEIEGHRLSGASHAVLSKHGVDFHFYDGEVVTLWRRSGGFWGWGVHERLIPGDEPNNGDCWKNDAYSPPCSGCEECVIRGDISDWSIEPMKAIP